MVESAYTGDLKPPALGIESSNLSSGTKNYNPIGKGADCKPVIDWFDSSIVLLLESSSNGKTTVFDTDNVGSIPSLSAYGGLV